MYLKPQGIRDWFEVDATYLLLVDDSVLFLFYVFNDIRFELIYSKHNILYKNFFYDTVHFFYDTVFIYTHPQRTR